MDNLLEVGYTIRHKLGDLLMEEYNTRKRLAEIGLYKLRYLWTQMDYFIEMTPLWTLEYLDQLELRGNSEHVIFIGLCEKEKLKIKI